MSAAGPPEPSPRPAASPGDGPPAGPLGYGSERAALAVSLDAAARSERDGWAALGRGEVSKPAPPDTRTGAVDANGLLVVPASRVAARREGGRYRPVFLVGAHLAGDPRTLDALERAGTGGSEGPVVRGGLRSTRIVAGWVRGFLYLHVVLAVALVGLALSGVEAAGTAPLARRDPPLHAELGALQSGLFIASGIAWMVWQHRLHSNLLHLGAAGVSRSPSVGVLWWLVPPANLLLPYVVMRRLWKAGVGMGEARDVRDQGPPPSPGLWWAAWIVSAAAGVGGLSAETGREVLLWGTASNTALVAAGTFAVGMVRGIQRQHAALVGITT